MWRASKEHGRDVGLIKLPNLKGYKDRHGKPRYYVRLKGRPAIVLKGEPGSEEWLSNYSAAVASVRQTAKKSTPGGAGTGDVLLAEFYGSDYWLNTLKPNTQANYKNIYERWRAVWGANAVATLTKKDCQAMLDERAATPGAARSFLKRMRVLFDFAIDRDYRKDNPFRQVKLKAYKSQGFIPWSDEDIQRFKSHHPAGSRARRAMVLLLYTTQRRSDVHRMGRQHTRDVVFDEGQDPVPCIVISQVKGRKGEEPVTLVIPMHPELKAELDLTPAGDMQFVVTSYGKGFSPAGFTSWFVEQAQAAGLQDRTPHGLRKAGSRRLAEGGAGAPQIRAVTGHKSLAEVERYIASAQQPRLAKLAMDAMSKGKAGTGSV